MKTHLRDIRLMNNAGMQFPLCYANAPLLDVDKSALPTTGNAADVTCKRCAVQAPGRYSWAYRPADFKQA